MGNTFRLDLGPLGGHAVENYFVGPRAFALGERAFEGPKDGSGTEPVFWRESQDGLQVEGAVYGGRSTQPARSTSASVSFAPANVGALQKRIKAMRGRHRRWGGKKIRARLRELHPGQRVPAVRTMTRWLGCWNVGKERRRRSPKGPVIQRRKLTIAKRVNAVWTVDFKGWWCTADGSRVEPLTVQDLFSRYLLGIRVLPDQKWWRVKRVFIGLFRRYGMPQIIRVDNGGPFGSTGPAGLSRLSAWWASLGIEVEFIRPAHPQDNGAHEQMHRELKAEAARPVSSTPTGATAQAGALAPLLQSGAAARGVGPTDTRQKVSAQFDQIQDPNWPLEISSQLGSSSGAQQRTDPLAGTAALHRRSFCGLSDRTPEASPKESGLFTFSGYCSESCANSITVV